MYTCANYNDEFICGLLSEVEAKIAFVADRDYKNKIYDLGIKKEVSDYNILLELKEILESILKCNSCFEGIEIEDVVNLVKNKLNNC